MDRGEGAGLAVGYEQALALSLRLTAMAHRTRRRKIY